MFRELATRFPRHRYTERAAWKAGWAAYRGRRFDEAVRLFESAAVAFPRADYRPSWLYWSARSRDQLNDAATANERYRLVVSDYRNSYYGRLAATLLTTRREQVLPALSEPVAPNGAPTKLPPTDALMRELTALQLYDDALREVQYAQRVWGDTPPLQATTAWIRHRQGLGLTRPGAFQLHPRRHHDDAPRVSAVSRRRRRRSAGRRPADHLPARLLAADPEVLVSSTRWIRISSRR